MRFLLIYTPESLYHSFAQILVTVDDYETIPHLMNDTLEDLEEMFPQAVVNTKAFLLGPSEGGKIQLRITGPDPNEVRALGAKAEAILLEDPVSKGVRHEWRNKVKVEDITLSAGATVCW